MAIKIKSTVLRLWSRLRLSSSLFWGNFSLSFLLSLDLKQKLEPGTLFLCFHFRLFCLVGFIAVPATRILFHFFPGPANKYHKNSLPVPSGVFMNFSRIEKNFPPIFLCSHFFSCRLPLATLPAFCFGFIRGVFSHDCCETKQ